MNLKEIKVIANKKGIKPGTMKKEEIIKAIQKAEGNFDCFANSSAVNCEQTTCFWRKDCLPS